MLKKIIYLMIFISLSCIYSAHASTTDSMLSQEAEDAAQIAQRDDYQKPFSDRYNGDETISTSTGALSNQVTDLTLPGVNGHDLMLRRQYRSQDLPYFYYVIASNQYDYHNYERPAYFYYIINSNGSRQTLSTPVLFDNETDMLENANDSIVVPGNLSDGTIESDDGIEVWYYNTIRRFSPDDGNKIAYRDKNAPPIYTQWSVHETIYTYGNISQNSAYHIAYNWYFMLPSLYHTYTEGGDTVDESGYFFDGEGGMYPASEYAERVVEDGNVIWKNSELKIDAGQTSITEPVFRASFISKGDITEGGISYNRIIINKLGKKFYFNTVGNIVAVDDKFGNRIKYEYSGGKISKIIDTHHQEVVFNWSQNSLTITYGDKIITYHFDQLANDNIGDLYQLSVKYNNQFEVKYIHRQKVISTKGYAYDIDPSYWGSKLLGVDISNTTIFNLEKIIYPNGKETVYQYDSFYLPCNRYGIKRKFKIKNRKDTAGSNIFSNYSYSYDYEYDGLTQNEIKRKTHDDDYTYTGTVIDEYNESTKADIYDMDNRLMSSEKKSVDDYWFETYEYNASQNNNLITKVTETMKNNKSSSNSMQKITTYAYDNKFNVITEAMGNQITNYTYEPTYSMMLTKTFKRDAAHEVIEQNIPYGYYNLSGGLEAFHPSNSMTVKPSYTINPSTKECVKTQAISAFYAESMQTDALNLKPNVNYILEFDCWTNKINMPVTVSIANTDLPQQQYSAAPVCQHFKWEFSSGSPNMNQAQVCIAGEAQHYNYFYYFTNIRLYRKDGAFGEEGVVPVGALTDKCIGWQRVYERELNASGQYVKTTLKQETKYDYDSYGNITAVHDWTKNNEEPAYIPSGAYDSQQEKNWMVDSIIFGNRSQEYIQSKKVDRMENIYYNTGDIQNDPEHKAYTLHSWTDDVANMTDDNTDLPDCTVSQQKDYDLYGNLKKDTNSKGIITNYAYDSLDRLEYEYYNDGTNKHYTYNIEQNYVIHQDENGNQTKAQYDSLGNLTGVYANKGTAAAPNWVQLKGYTYNPAGQKQTETIYKKYDQSSGTLLEKLTTTYDYYKSGKLKSQTTVDQSNQLVSAASYTYNYGVSDNINGVSGSYYTEETNIHGDSSIIPATTKKYYDQYGYMVKEEVTHKQQNGSNVVYKTTYLNDYLGNKIAVKDARAYDENWPNSATVTYEYDYANRVVKETNVQGKSINTEYNTLGKVTKKENYNNNVTQYEYNEIGLLTKAIQPFNGRSSSQIKYYYDKSGNQVRVLQQNNKPGEQEDFNRTEYKYDTRDRLKTVVQYDQNGSDIEIPSYTQYAYDPAGRKIKMFTGLSAVIDTATEQDNPNEPGADTDFAVTRYRYNYLNQLTGITDPNGKETQYTYDMTGNVLSTLNRIYSTTNYSYNGLGKMLTKEVIRDGVTDTIINTYDILGNRQTMKTYRNGIETSTASYSYDDLSRLLTETTTEGITKTYTYDASNNKKSFILSKNGAAQINLTYTYDNLNRLDLVNDQLAGGSNLADYGYDNNGNRNSLKYLNGTETSYTYNYANKLETMTNSKAGSILSKFDYTYYLNGNQESKLDNAGIRTNYIYDGLGRLKTEAVNGGMNIGYTYDDYSNRRTMAITGIAAPFTTSYDYDKNNRLLTETKITGDEQEITHYQYDDNGNMTYKGKETTKPATGEAESFSMYVAGENPGTNACFYEYDGFNQLTKAIEGDKTITYAYNGDGLRTSKTVNGITTNHVWDGQDMVAEMDGSGNINNKYIRGIGLIASDIGGTRNYYLYNGHGDTTQLTDASGNVIKNYDYDAFGVEKNPDPADNQPFRYAGEYFDKETVTYYLRARNYDPSIGRFTTEDSYWQMHDGIYGDDPLQVSGYAVDVVAETTMQIMRQQEAEKGKLPWVLEGEGDSTAKIIAQLDKELGMDKDENARIEEAIKNAKLVSIGAIMQSENLYGYCGNNPIMYIDPSGNAYFTKPENPFDKFIGIFTAIGKIYNRAVVEGTLRTWGNIKYLDRHFKDHGSDFGCQNEYEYVKKANEFYNNRGSYLRKVDSDGVIRVYDPNTNTFGAYNPNGTTRTFFKPQDGINYWNRQPGN